ncbi:MAG: TIGR02099 family protein, partial [Comamonadaceae bacterium]
GGAVDLALARVDAVLGPRLESLALRAVTGRLAGSLTQDSFQFSTTNLQFDTADGKRWPGGNLSFQRTPAKGRMAERGVFRADRLDLAALALIANRLPLDDATHRALAIYALRGLVERIDASWQGPLAAPDEYTARGRVSALSIASQAGAPPAAAATAPRGTPVAAPVPVGTPGVRGATVVFEATQAGGTAELGIAKGALELPGVFEEPVVPLDHLSAKLAWKLDGPKVQLAVTGVRFGNADAQGEARADWRTSDPASSPSRALYPGVLDLQGQLTQANGTRVFRYLPLVIPKATRDYVRDSVVKGSASTVDFKVRGDLWDMPFMDPRQGDFRIASRVADVTYAFAPPPPGATQVAGGWPALTGLSGELVFERAGMQVRGARGRIVGAPGIEVSRAEAEIADMTHATALLKVDAQAKGPLAELLKVAAPIAGGAVGEAASRARATGNADYKLHLELPLEAMDKV